MATISVESYTGTPFRPTIPHDPNSQLDYGVDWTARMVKETDAIVSSTWILEPPLQEVPGKPNSFDIYTTVCWITGGTVGKTHRATNRITTADGRTIDRSIFLRIVER